LEPGDKGLAVAKLESGEIYESGVPNLLLEKVNKVPVTNSSEASVAMKRPAAAITRAIQAAAAAAPATDDAAMPAEAIAERLKEEQKETDLVVPPAGKKSKAKEASASNDHAPVLAKTYGRMWYKNGERFGVRQKFGEKRQVWQVSMKSTRFTDTNDLAQLIDAAILLMETGKLEEQEGMSWVLSRAK
jgi:hypothetical protein